MDAKIVIDTLRASFERQLAIYRELRDQSRAAMSKLILSRGDMGVLMAGVDKKSRLLEEIGRERAGMTDHIKYWQDNRDKLANDKSAAAFNDVLAQTELAIKEFLTEEEKLKQYMEKAYKPLAESA